MPKTTEVLCEVHFCIDTVENIKRHFDVAIATFSVTCMAENTNYLSTYPLSTFKLENVPFVDKKNDKLINFNYLPKLANNCVNVLTLHSSKENSNY